MKPPRWDAATWALMAPVLNARCLGRCDDCGKDLHGSVERHHRQRRRVGGDRLANLVMLHPACHARLHAHPEQARADGLIVSAYETDLASVPMLWRRRHTVLLRDDGTLEKILIPPDHPRFIP